MATNWTNLVNAAAQGITVLTNGSFAGNANGWILGAGWAYSANSVVHTPGNVLEMDQQNLVLVVGSVYTIALTITGTAGTLRVEMAGFERTYAAGVGLVEFTGVSQEADSSLNLEPSTAFNGAVSGISARVSTGGGWTDISDPSAPSYTNIAKPSNGQSIIYGGTPIGLLLALTYAIDVVTGGIWTDVAENSSTWTDIPSNSANWTAVPKAT